MSESTGTSPESGESAKRRTASISLVEGEEANDNFEAYKAILQPQFDAIGATLTNAVVLANALRSAVTTAQQKEPQS